MIKQSDLRRYTRFNNLKEETANTPTNNQKYRSLIEGIYKKLMEDQENQGK